MLDRPQESQGLQGQDLIRFFPSTAEDRFPLALIKNVGRHLTKFANLRKQIFIIRIENCIRVFLAFLKGCLNTCNNFINDVMVQICNRSNSLRQGVRTSADVVLGLKSPPLAYSADLANLLFTENPGNDTKTCKRGI